MASLKDLRRRLGTVGNIKQVTRAMEMVATTKLRRFQDRATSLRPFTEEALHLVRHLVGVLGPVVDDMDLFQRGEGEKIAVLLVSSDRGLCGAYNSNLFIELERWMEGRDRDQVQFYVYGRKGYQYLTKRGYHIEHYLADPPLEQIDVRNVSVVTTSALRAFEAGEFAELKVLYTAFESMIKYVPTWLDVLPVEAPSPEAGEQAKYGPEVILEPDARTILERLIPGYLNTIVYNALLQSITSEYASRRVSMKAATDAATDMQKVLRGIYNRKRQEIITSELLDIVGGAEALR
jgi:F-type H+-transporting ATPase subunit gamma